MSLQPILRGIVLLAIVLACLDKSAVWAQSKFQQTRFGILYDTWHCLATSRVTTPYDISKALAGSLPWGPIPAFHYWTEPQPGYYCLDPNLPPAQRQNTNVDLVLKLHARQLHDAGIDFIILDASNNELVDDARARSKISIQEPFAELLKVWNSIPDAPKVVIFAPLTENGAMFEWLLTQLAAYRQLQFTFQGKPLALAVDNRHFPVDAAKYQRLSSDYTLRKMWGLIREDGDVWNFISLCANDDAFRASQGTAQCNQRVAHRGSSVEQIPVAAAFQETYMSYEVNAVPKYQGRTFVQQFAVAFAHPEAPIVTINSWNEWIVQRFCLDGNGHATAAHCSSANDHFPNGNKVFVDTYDAEYSRDVEPSKEAPGDFYYKLMANCIKKYRQGILCHASDVPYRK